MPRHVTLAALWLCAAWIAPAHAGGVGFTVTDLGTLGGKSFGTAINARGDVAGYSYTADVSHAFVYRDGAMVDLGAYGGGTMATGIDDAGRAVGSVYHSAVGVPTPVIWEAGVQRDLTVLPGRPYGVAVAINNAGQIAGSLSANDGAFHAARFSAAGTQDLGEGYAYAINAYGVVAGYSGSSAATFTGERVRSLGTLGGLSSQASGINDAGDVVGYSKVAGSDIERAFLYRDGVMRDLGTLGSFSGASGINNAGQVVGYSNAPSGQHGFLWSSTGIRDLNDFLLETPGLRIGAANAINASGQIVADGGNGHAVLLTPTGTLTWSAAAGGRAADSTNWDSELGFSPSAYFDVVINPRASQTVTLDQDAAVKTLVIGGGAGITTLALKNGAGILGAGAAHPVTIEANGVLTGDGHVDGSVTNRGTVLAAAGARLVVGLADTGGTPGFDNRGLVTGNGSIAGHLTNEATGKVRVGAGQVLTLEGDVTSRGGVEAREGGELRVTGAFANEAGGVVRLDKATLRFDSGLVNAGQVQISFGGASVFGAVTNQAGAKVIASGGANVTFWDGMTNDGEVRASAGSHLVYFGLVDGGGGFTSNGAGAYHRFEGGYSPGHSPAEVSVGDVQFASTLTMQIGGLLPGSQHDQIHFTGSVLFDTGFVLDVELIDGFTPAAGERFTLFTFENAPVGNFDSLVLPGLASGLAWDTSGLYSQGALRVTAVPEPATGALWLLGLASLAGLMRRRATSRRSAARIPRLTRHLHQM